MGMFHNIMNKLGRYRLVPDRLTGDDYLHRYYLFLKDRKWFPFNITLHKILKSDEPVYHDHPWPYMTIILKGGYWEWVPQFTDGKKSGEYATWRGPGSVIRRKARELHYLEIDETVGPATTLFIMGPQQREWGFIVDEPRKATKWIQWQEYLKSKKV